MTLGELQRGRAGSLIVKEAWLGLCNGALIGFTAGAGCSSMHGSANARALDARRGRHDLDDGGLHRERRRWRRGAARAAPARHRPVTASSIFLTTATDCASMEIFLGLATLLV